MKQLTAEEIQNEIPGANLDQWLAGRVMTIPRLYAYRQLSGTGGYFAEFGEELAVRDHAMSEATPHYSTDIADAWKVVEELNTRGLPFRLELDAGGRVRAGFGSEDGQVEYQEVECICTVPEAICKAALLASLLPGW